MLFFRGTDLGDLGDENEEAGACFFAGLADVDFFAGADAVGFLAGVGFFAATGADAGLFVSPTNSFKPSTERCLSNGTRAGRTPVRYMKTVGNPLTSRASNENASGSKAARLSMVSTSTSTNSNSGLFAQNWFQWGLNAVQ